MKFYFDKKVAFGFAITITVLATLGIFSFTSTQRLINTTLLLTHGLNVISNGDLVLKSVLELETGERGYIITGDSTFLDNYRNSPRGIDYYMHKLDSLTKHDTTQTARVDTLLRLVNSKRAISDSLMLTRRSMRDPSNLIADPEARRISNEIRKCIQRLQLTEGDNFRSHNTIKGNSLLQFQLSLVGLALSCVIIILVLFYFINKTMKARNEAQEKLRLSAENMQASLENELAIESQKLAEANNLYRSLAANIPGSAITVLDRQEHFLLAEGDLLKQMGFDKDQMTGKAISQLIDAENYKYYKGLIDRAFNGETILVEGQPFADLYTLIKVVPLYNHKSQLFAIMFVLIDVTQLKIAQFNLEQLNNGLETKIFERTEQLNESNKQLEAFTYSVSHDLRAPLRSIEGYAQILLEDHAPALGQEGTRVNKLVITNAHRMTRLIDDLLNFSKVTRKEISTAPIDMDALVRELIEDIRAEHSSRLVNVQIADLDWCLGDASLIRQVWINLISNAFKYTGNREVSIIEIGSLRENGVVQYWVKDNGAGFDMQYADKLFGVFQRLHKASEFEGTGVGLALAKTIVQRHGGTIWANATVGEGAEFRFTLPEYTSEWRK